MDVSPQRRLAPKKIRPTDVVTMNKLCAWRHDMLLPFYPVGALCAGEQMQRSSSFPRQYVLVVTAAPVSHDRPR